MKCPHCSKEIDVSTKLMELWYAEDIRKRITAYTGNSSIGKLVQQPGAYGIVANNMRTIEDCAAAVVTAYHRGQKAHLESGQSDGQ